MVTMVIGKVSTSSTGRTSAFTSPSTTAPIASDRPPPTRTPSSAQSATTRAMAVINQCAKKPMAQSWTGAPRDARPVEPHRSVQAVVQLARLDSQRQVVRLGRQGAGRETGEGAGRGVRLVEVQHPRAVAGLVRVEEAPAAVGLVPAGLVAKDEEQLLGVRLFVNRLESQVLPLQRERHVP